MATLRKIICDVCKEETPRFGAGSIALSIEVRRPPQSVRALRARRHSRGVRRRMAFDFHDVDLCKACTKRPLTVAALLRAAKDHEKATHAE